MKADAVPSGAQWTVMLDARYVGAEDSGIGRYTQELARWLPRLDPTLRLELLCDPARPDANLGPDAPGLGFQSYPAPPNSLRTRFALARAVDLRGAQLYHAPFNILPRGLAVPRLFTLHDIMWLRDVGLCTDVWWRQRVTGTFYRTLIPRAAAEARRILTVSEHSRADIEARFPAARGRVSVTYNGVDPRFTPMAPEDAWQLAAKHLPRGAPFVLVVGQGAPYKNHPRAAAAFLEAFASTPDVRLVLVRRLSRSTDDALGRTLAHPSLRGRVHALPHIDVDTLRALYSLAQTFLFPSLYEGFGLPALEAMACGAPVVTSDVGAPAEVCGPAALTVNPLDVSAIAEGLRRVHEDTALRADLRARGLAHAATFTWERCARQTLAAYRQALAD